MRPNPFRTCACARLLPPLLWLLAAGCAPRAAPPRTPLDVELRTADGEMLALGSLRGEPLLLFLFTTYDDASQLALGALIEARRALGDLQVLGVALQPDAGPFLRAYGDALAVDFPLTYEPDATIVAGHSALGSPVSVPTFVLLDAEGHPVEVLVGVPKPGDLVEMVSAAHP